MSSLRWLTFNTFSIRSFKGKLPEKKNFVTVDRKQNK